MSTLTSTDICLVSLLKRPQLTAARISRGGRCITVEEHDEQRKECGAGVLGAVIQAGGVHLCAQEQGGRDEAHDGNL